MDKCKLERRGYEHVVAGGGLKFCVCVRGTLKKSVRSRKRA